jgi:hypothetical protein
MPNSSTPDLAKAVREHLMRPAPQRRPQKNGFTMKSLRQIAIWGATAAGALLLAVLTSRSQVGEQRIALVLHDAPAATQPFDAQAETQRLATAVHGLAVDGNQIKARLASVEQDMNDVTGSISKQIESVDRRRQEDGPTVADTAVLTTVLIPAAAPSHGFAATPATATLNESPSALAPRVRYGVDIGSGLTIQALRARWAVIQSAHPDLFAGLQPIVTVKEIPRLNRVELRLVAGPLAETQAATQLCATLTAFGLFCQPTLFDGQHLALR